MSREKSEIFLTLGKSIRSERKKQELSQIELSNKIGVTSKTIGLIEMGRVSPNDGTLRLIAQGLNLPAEYFLDPNVQAEARKRIVFELELPDGFEFTDDELSAISDRARRFVHDTATMILNLRKKKSKK